MLYNVEAMDVKTFTHNPIPEEMPDLKTDMSEGFRQYVLPSGGKYHSVTTVTGHKKSEFFKEWRMKNPKELLKPIQIQIEYGIKPRALAYMRELSDDAGELVGPLWINPKDTEIFYVLLL